MAFDDFDDVLDDVDEDLGDIAGAFASIAKAAIEAKAGTAKYKEEIRQLNITCDSLRGVVRSLREELRNVSNVDAFQQMQATAEQTASQFRDYIRAIGLQFDQLDDYDNHTIQDMYESLSEGAITYSDAIATVRSSYAQLIRESSDTSPVDGMFQQLLSTMQEVAGGLDQLRAQIDDIATNGVKAIAAPEVQAPSKDNELVDYIKQFTEVSAEMTDEAKAAYDPLIKLVEALNSFGNVDDIKLSTIANTFRNLSDIGTGSFSNDKIAKIADLAIRLRDIAAGGFGEFKFDISGLNGLKIDKRNVEKFGQIADKLAAITPDQFAGLIELGNNAGNIEKILSVDPSNGINNLKVSKAALTNLAEKLPAIQKVNAEKLAAIFNVNTTGINNLKVSKASIENVTNLARAAEILKNNGIDLTLKGDATEELKKLTQETVDATGAAVKLRTETQGIADSFQSSTQPLEKTQSLLNGISVSVDEFDESKLKQIQWALGKEGVNADDQNRIMSLFKDLNGEITSVTAKYKEFASVGEHVSQVLIQGIDEYGRAFSKAIDWKEYTDVDPLTGDKTPSFGPFISGTIKYNAAKEQLIDTTKAEADVEERLYNIRKQLRQASLSGIDDNNINYQNVQAYADAVREMFTQVDADSTTQKQWLANLDALDAKYRVATLGLKEDTEAAKANAKARGELVRIVEAQAKITMEIDATEKLLRKAQDAGVSDSDKNIVALREHIATMREFRDELDPATTLQKDFTATFNELSAAATPASTGLKNTIDRAKEYAQAEKEAVDVDEARIEVLKELQRVQDLLNKAYQSGISIDDPHVQALMKAGDELYNYESKIGQAGQTQKQFKDGLDAIKVSYAEEANSIQHSTKEHEVRNKRIAQATKIYDEVEKSLDKYKDAQNSSNDEARTAYATMNSLTSTLIEATAKYDAGAMTEEQYNTAVRNATDSLKEQSDVLDKAGYGVDKTSNKFDGLIQQLTRFLTPLYMARKAWQTLKEMANVVIELEDAFAQLEIVTGATESELEQFYQTSSKIASELGKSITDIAASIEVFSRLGYSLPDATVLAQYATILSNVANVTTDEATTGLTSVIKGFGMHVDQAEHVSDVLVSIGQRYAVSAGELMEAFQRAGAALAATNTSFDKSAALIAAANAAIQNSSTVGRFMPMHTVMCA